MSKLRNFYDNLVEGISTDIVKNKNYYVSVWLIC